jgi:hypothetical protein
MNERKRPTGQLIYLILESFDDFGMAGTNASYRCAANRIENLRSILKVEIRSFTPHGHRWPPRGPMKDICGLFRRR